jgi:hypothetical protein
MRPIEIKQLRHKIGLALGCKKARIAEAEAIEKVFSKGLNEAWDRGGVVAAANFQAHFDPKRGAT